MNSREIKAALLQYYRYDRGIGGNMGGLVLSMRLLMPMLVTVMAADLLYLYYTGQWYEPIIAILATELIVLWVLVSAGIAWMVFEWRH